MVQLQQQNLFKGARRKSFYAPLSMKTMEEEPVLQNGEFTPAPQLKRLYYTYVVLVTLFLIFPWYIPLQLLFFLAGFIVFGLFLLPIFVLFAYWVPTYCETMVYQFTDTEMVWKRGVWFRQTGIVPYNRITNVDISQGPIARSLGIASLNVHTAGYSAGSGAGGAPELKILGVERFEELRDIIMGFVRSKEPVAIETYEKPRKPSEPKGEDVSSRILAELTRIRELMEKERE
jgi:membrane protein YdbS with pleckstrin-like domain